ncbi:hypothetical protein CAPTEDRAFT_191573, partial [Capitella teleta]
QEKWEGNIGTTFHVVLPMKDFTFNKNSDQLFVRFDHETLGGFKPKDQDPTWPLKLQKEHDGLLYMTCFLDIAKVLFPVQYKYVVVKTDGKSVWETYGDDLYANRSLIISKDKLLNTG